MKKQAGTYEGVMLAAMADELAHIPAEKLALNLGPAMGVLQNVAGRVAQAAPRAITAMEGVGSHVVRGLEAAGSAGMSHAAPMARQMGQGVITGLNKAEGALGGGLAGARNLNRAAGAGAVGLGAIGALGAAGAARRAVAGPQPTQITVR